MAAFDQIWSNESTGASTVAVTGVAPAGTNRLLVVDTGHAWGGARTVNSITKGATAITLENWDDYNPNYWDSTSRYLVAPTTTSETVTVTLSGTADTLFCAVTSYTAVDQTTPVDAASTNNQDSFDPTGLTITSATSDMVHSSIHCGWHSGLTFQGDGTERYDSGSIIGYSRAAVANAPGAASVNVEWGGGSGYNSAHVMGGFNINDAGGAPAANPKGVFGMPFHGPFGGPIG